MEIPFLRKAGGFGSSTLQRRLYHSCFVQNFVKFSKPLEECPCIGEGKISKTTDLNRNTEKKILEIKTFLETSKSF